MIGKQLEAMQQTWAKAPVRIFASSYIKDYVKPYGLQRADEAGPAGRNMCTEYMVDSGFSDTSVTNRTVWENAKKHRADWMIPKDYPGNRHKTRQSVKEFVRRYWDRREETTATTLIPLQPPHAREYKEHEEFYSQFGRFALGGMVGMDPEEQVKHIKEFREVAGYDCVVHGFGVGTSLEVIKALRKNPHLLDSFDIATMEKVLIFGKMPDKHWSQMTFELPHGTGSTRVRAQFASALLTMLHYMLGPGVNDEVLEQEYEQTKLGDFEDVSQQMTIEKMKKAEKAIRENRVEEVDLFDGKTPELSAD